MPDNFKSKITNDLGESLEIKYNRPDDLESTKVTEMYMKIIEFQEYFEGRGDSDE